MSGLYDSEGLMLTGRNGSTDFKERFAGTGRTSLSQAGTLGETRELSNRTVGVEPIHVADSFTSSRDFAVDDDALPPYGVRDGDVLESCAELTTTTTEPHDNDVLLGRGSKYSSIPQKLTDLSTH